MDSLPPPSTDTGQEELPATLGGSALLRKLSQGGSAELFLVEGEAHPEVIKRWKVGSCPQRARLEFELLSRQLHPSLPRASELFLEEGQSCIRMEWIQGLSLLDASRSLGPLSHPDRHRQLRTWALELIDILAMLHRHGWVHRDVKLNNLMVESSGRLRLIDLGSGSDLDEGGHTIYGEFLGTLSYAPPEQLRGEVLDPRVDLYALGGVLYRLACGRKPSPELEPWPLLLDAKRRDYISPRQRVPQLPQDLSRLIDACLESDPSERPRSALAAAAWLRRGGRGEIPDGIILGREVWLKNQRSDLWGEAVIQLLLPPMESGEVLLERLLGSLRMDHRWSLEGDKLGPALKRALGLSPTVGPRDCLRVLRSVGRCALIFEPHWAEEIDILASFIQWLRKAGVQVWGFLWASHPIEHERVRVLTPPVLSERAWDASFRSLMGGRIAAPCRLPLMQMLEASPKRLEQFLAQARAEGKLKRDPDGVCWPVCAQEDGPQVTELAALSEHLLAALQLLALAGGSLSVSSFVQAMDLEPSALSQLLKELHSCPQVILEDRQVKLQGARFAADLRRRTSPLRRNWWGETLLALPERQLQRMEPALMAWLGDPERAWRVMEQRLREAWKTSDSPPHAIAWSLWSLLSEPAALPAPEQLDLPFWRAWCRLPGSGTPAESPRASWWSCRVQRLRESDAHDALPGLNQAFRDGVISERQLRTEASWCALRMGRSEAAWTMLSGLLEGMEAGEGQDSSLFVLARCMLLRGDLVLLQRSLSAWRRSQEGRFYERSPEHWRLRALHLDVLRMRGLYSEGLRRLERDLQGAHRSLEMEGECWLRISGARLCTEMGRRHEALRHLRVAWQRYHEAGSGPLVRLLLLDAQTQREHGQGLQISALPQERARWMDFGWGPSVLQQLVIQALAQGREREALSFLRQGTERWGAQDPEQRAAWSVLQDRLEPTATPLVHWGRLGELPRWQWRLARAQSAPAGRLRELEEQLVIQQEPGDQLQLRQILAAESHRSDGTLLSSS